MSNVSLSTFKTYLQVTRNVDVGDDDMLQAALEAADEAINEECQRQFSLAGAASPRTFDPTGTLSLRIPDCTTVTAISLDSATVSVAAVNLLPTMRTSWTAEPRPIEEIYRPYGGFYPTSPLSVVTVTATWGWSAIPDRVLEASKILAKDILTNRSVSFGIAGFTQYGIKAHDNPQVMALIGRLKRAEAFGIA